jgi:hypothetical protein
MTPADVVVNGVVGVGCFGLVGWLVWVFLFGFGFGGSGEERCFLWGCERRRFFIFLLSLLQRGNGEEAKEEREDARP